MEREIEALENVERYQGSRVEIEDHATEQVGGVKRIEALGALKLLSGGSASLAAVDDLHQATGRDLNLVAGQRYNATIGAGMDERIQECAGAWRPSPSTCRRRRHGWGLLT